MLARILDVCDAAAARVAAGLFPGDATDVGRRYLFRRDDAADLGLADLAGRAVWVFPAIAAQEEVVSRSVDANDYGVLVLVLEKYSGPGLPPDSWLDERVGFVEAMVYRPLTDQRGDPLTLPGGCAVPQTGQVTVVYDPAVLAEHGLFWSEAEFTFREYA